MDVMEKGKTFEDLDLLADTEITNFIDGISFQAVIPYFEEAIEYYKYIKPDLMLMPSIVFRVRDFLNIKNLVPKEIKKFVMRFRNYMISDKLTKNIRVELINDILRVEYKGNFPNLHYDLSKAYCALFGTLGFEIQDFIYSKNEMYVRGDFVQTDLAKEERLAVKKRKSLALSNIDYFVNKYNMVKDKQYHLWLELSNDNSSIITFQNSSTIENWINQIENDVIRYGSKEEQILIVLKFFESLHWIRILRTNKLEVQFLLSEDKYQNEVLLFREIISRYSRISQNAENIYLIE